MRTHIIDATNKAPGRIASQAAWYLMGKDSPDYQKHVAAPVRVQITNASKAKIHPRKQDQKTYSHYTGYPSGLRQEKLGHLIERKGHAVVFERAVYGMLPANKLRKIIMTHLEITD